MTQEEYSKRRYERRKNNGLCPICGKKLDRAGHYCTDCLEKSNKYHRETRDFCRQMGICPQCRKEKLFGSERLCISCRQKNYDRSLKKPPTDEQRIKYAERLRIKQKNLYRERVEKGICTRCGKFKAAAGKRKCPICLEKDAEVHRLRRQEKEGR